MRSILPKVITIGDPDSKTPTIQKPGGTTTISKKDAQRYLEMATEHINSRLRPVYLTPLKRYKVLEVTPIENVKKGSKTVRVPDNGIFVVGMWVRITSDNGTELHEVKNIPEENIYDVELEDAVTKDHPLSATPYVSLLRFPDPVMSMCAKMGVSLLIDRQFVAEQEPDVSNYGKTLRSACASDMDAILSGVIRLEGQEHTGRRFVRISLFDKWSTTGEFQLGGGKEA
jgi:hypothetical protein